MIRPDNKFYRQRPSLFSSHVRGDAAPPLAAFFPAVGRPLGAPHSAIRHLVHGSRPCPPRAPRTSSAVRFRRLSARPAVSRSYQRLKPGKVLPSAASSNHLIRALTSMMRRSITAMGMRSTLGAVRRFDFDMAALHARQPAPHFQQLLE